MFNSKKFIIFLGRLQSVLAIHDEVSNAIVLVEPSNGNVISINTKDSSWFQPLKDLAMNFSSTASNKTSQKRDFFYRMRTDFASDNKLLFFTPNGNIVQQIDLSGDIPKLFKIELPFNIESLHPLNEHQFFISATSEKEGIGKVSKFFILRKESNEEPLPNILNPVVQDFGEGSNPFESVVGLNKEGMSDFGLKIVLKESVSSPNTLFTTPNSYATLAMGFPELEFSPNEIYTWPKQQDSEDPDHDSTLFQKSNFTQAPGFRQQYSDQGE